jgi:hypothetical protein
MYYHRKSLCKVSDYMKHLLLTRLSHVCLLLAIVVLLVGCGQASPTLTSLPSPTSTLNPSLALSPEPTRVPAMPEAGIELISGMPNGCMNTDQNQSTVFGFNVIYHTVTTGNYQTGTLVAPDGAVLANVNSETENRNGEGRWGFYPSPFDYPANTSLMMTLTTYAGIDATTPISSISTLTYNCTTGEAISKTYTRGK